MSNIVCNWTTIMGIFACAAVGEIGSWRSIRLRLIWSILDTLIALGISLKQIKEMYVSVVVNLKL